MRESQADLGPQSRALLHLDIRQGATWEPSTGLLVAHSGQRFAWSRGTTLASVPVPGGSYTAPATMPAWAEADSALALHLGADDLLREAVATPWRPTPFFGRLRFIERGARTTSNATLFAITPDDPTSGTRFYLFASSNYYALFAHNGTTSATATLSAGQPAPGDVVTVDFAWAAAGLALHQRIGAGAPTSATSGALALPSAWSAGTRARIGRRGATANPASLTLIQCALVPGAYDVDTLDTLF
jgi:hypothetical protein